MGVASGIRRVLGRSLVPVPHCCGVLLKSLEGDLSPFGGYVGLPWFLWGTTWDDAALIERLSCSSGLAVPQTIFVHDLGSKSHFRYCV